MNAHKFVAEHGVEQANSILEKASPSATHFTEALGGHYAKEVLFKSDFRWAWYDATAQAWYYDIAEKIRIELAELKQVVESVEIVNEKGGLTLLKGLVELGRDLANWMEKGNEKMSPQKPDTKNLMRCEKAIADYELVESYKQVKVEVSFGIALQRNQSIGAKCEVLDVVDVSPNCEVRNG